MLYMSLYSLLLIVTVSCVHNVVCVSVLSIIDWVVIMASLIVNKYFNLFYHVVQEIKDIFFDEK